MRTVAYASIAALAAVALAGCPDNPYSADTWIEKLDDPKEAERAITELQNLCNPKAIEPLGKYWSRNNKPTRVLQVIIELSRPLTAEEAEAKFCTDYDAKHANGRPASWDKALPFLREAIEGVDGNSQRSIDDAVKAAEALGDAQPDEVHPDVVAPADSTQILVDAINKKWDAKSNAQRVRLTAIAALAKFKDPATKKIATTTLANVIRADPGAQPPQIVGAAINTLGELRTPEALPILLEAMYRAPLFFQQVHRALVASGPNVIGELKKILKHEHNDINALFKEKKLDKYCGDPGQTQVAPSECEDVSAMDYYAAIVVGDLHDQSAVPELLAALGRPLKPAYFSNFAPGPPAQNAVLDALRKLGDKSSAGAVLKFAADPKANDQLRPVAASVYGWVSHDGSESVGKTTGLKWLGERAADDKEAQTLRLAAAESYARLANSSAETAILKKLAGNYLDASGKAAKERDAETGDYTKAKKAFDDQRDPFLKAQANVERAKIAYDKKKAEVGGDPKKVPKADVDKYEAAKKALAEEKKKLEAARETWSKAGPKRAFEESDKEYEKAKDDYNAAKQKLEKAKADKGGDVTQVDPEILNEATLTKYMWDWIKANVYLPTKTLYDSLDQKSKGYKAYERGFENHIARIEIVIHCKGDAACYAKTFDAKAEDVFKRLKDSKLIDVKNEKDWTDEDKNELRVAQIERAVLELRRMGPKAQGQLNALLDRAGETDRIIRQSILLAVPRIAAVPCADCKKKLDAAIEKGKGKQELNDLNYQTQLLANYYAWAGSK